MTYGHLIHGQSHLKMPNKNYVRGRNKEYKICQQLREEGYDIVQRSAGSHSAVDVFAIRKRDRRILLIQAKPDSYSDSQIKKLLDEQLDLHGEFNVTFEVR